MFRYKIKSQKLLNLIKWLKGKVYLLLIKIMILSAYLIIKLSVN